MNDQERQEALERAAVQYGAKARHAENLCKQTKALAWAEYRSIATSLGYEAAEGPAAQPPSRSPPEKLLGDGRPLTMGYSYDMRGPQSKPLKVS